MRAVVLVLLLPLSSYAENWLPTTTVEFSGLTTDPTTYDNTTCANRCCRRAVLETEPDEACYANWRHCASLGGDAPFCGVGQSSNCSVWVPCEANDRVAAMFWWFMPLLVTVLMLFIGFIFAYESLISAYQSKTYDFTAEVAELILWAWLVIMLSFSVVANSDFVHWKASTEVDLRYVMYQSCREFCNGIRFNAPSFCSRCWDRADDWVSVQNASQFLFYFPLVQWLLLIVCLVIRLVSFSELQKSRMRDTATLSVLVACQVLVCLSCVAGFICASMYAAIIGTNDRPLASSAGLNGLYRFSKHASFGQSIQVDMYSVCVGWIFFCIFQFIYTADLTVNFWRKF